MQLMLTNRSTVQVPILFVHNSKWYSELLMPGVERTIHGATLTQVNVGRVSLGTAPDADSTAAKQNFVNGGFAMLGRSDSPAGVVVPIRLFVESFEGALTASEGTTFVAGDRKEVLFLDAGTLS